ncbi:helix-turn-helix family protein [Burkholderia pseudomallei]|uniref:Helix-turn-helix family protein n=2 Tax=Burkholderia pseudomallei TaxID=28450 RepID=A0AA40JJ02_BURPE|nr:helix-turn-helix family protein [Burkholderia pseudomallei]
MAGIDRTYVSMLERGVKSPTLDVMVSIAEALQISFVELTIAVQAEVLAEQSGS